MGNVYSVEDETYNETGNLIKVTDALGNTTSYEYDGEGRLIKATNPLGKSCYYTYAKGGILSGYTDYSGNEIAYTYDTKGRVSKVTDNDGITTYTYDDLSRLIKVADNNGVITYTYDDLSRLQTKTTYDLGTISYTYKKGGLIDKVTTSPRGGQPVITSYEYDLMERLVRVVGHDKKATLYEYDALGNCIAVKNEGGITITYEYDNCSRLINELVTDTDSNVLMYYNYTYGNDSEKTKAIEMVRESSTDASFKVVCNEYEYDTLLRLTGEKISVVGEVDVEVDRLVVGRVTQDNSVIEYLQNLVSTLVYDGCITNTYTYDAVSNRTSKTTTVTGTVSGLDEELETGTTTYTYNEFNQLMSAVREDGGITTTTLYEYDNNGNLVKETDGTETKTYTYNAVNKLITATISEGNNVTIESYEYDYEGNRISKQTNEEEKIYYHNETATGLSQVSVELGRNAEGTYRVRKYYTRGNALISMGMYGDGSDTQESGNAEEITTIQFIMDGHGSVTALAKVNATVLEENESVVLTDTYTYDAYGTLLNHTGETDNDYLYTGEQYNFTTKLYYLRARYMSPETGTFISMDTYSGTLDNPVSLHKYLYANANPVMYTDPTGYFSIMETQLAQTIKSTIQSASVPAMNFHKIMSWANMAVTAYDIGCQLRLFISGDGNFFGLVAAIAGGLITQSLINCGAKLLLGEAAVAVLKLVGIAQDTASFIDAVKSGDPVEIVFESMRLVVSIFTLKCQCFTGDTLVSTVDGYRRIDEIQTGDYIWSYDTETGERVEAKVTNVSVTETDVIVHVYTDDGEKIKTTMFHPFYVKGKDVADNEDISYNSGEWKAASNLRAGDELLTEDGKIVYVKEVQIERIEESIKVYNLEVEGSHTYYVGEGVLVHNMCAFEDGAATLAQYGDDFGKMGTYVENPNIKVDWTQYAEHAAERMRQRGITQEMINNIVEKGKVLSQNNGNKFAYINQEGVAIVSKEGKLITAWSSADFDSSMLEIISKLFGKQVK